MDGSSTQEITCVQVPIYKGLGIIAGVCISVVVAVVVLGQSGATIWVSTWTPVLVGCVRARRLRAGYERRELDGVLMSALGAQFVVDVQQGVADEHRPAQRRVDEFAGGLELADGGIHYALALHSVGRALVLRRGRSTIATGDALLGIASPALVQRMVFALDTCAY